MPRFYFDIRLKNGTILEDELGIELPDAEAARQEAIAGAVGLRQENAGRWNQTACTFEVSDSEHRQLFTLPFDVAVRPARRSVH
jgi:hypothetical protein